MRRLLSLTLTTILTGCAIPTPPSRSEVRIIQDASTGTTRVESVVDGKTYERVHELYDLLIAAHKYEQEKWLGITKTARHAEREIQVRATLPLPEHEGGLLVIAPDASNHCRFYMYDKKANGTVDSASIWVPNGGKGELYRIMIPEFLNKRYHIATSILLDLERKGMTHHQDSIKVDGETITFTPLR